LYAKDASILPKESQPAGDNLMVLQKVRIAQLTNQPTKRLITNPPNQPTN